MAIPQGRLSTTVVSGMYLPPEDRTFYANKSYEAGPTAINDTSAGLLYQYWTFTYNASNGEITATPETTGSPVVILTVLGITYFTCTFDQNARITVSYSNAVSCYLYWYDTVAGMSVTTDLGATVVTPAIYLDDKRDTQNAVNDMILWYTKPVGPTWTLYSLLQRDRFLTEYVMATGLTTPYLRTVGISDELRVQIQLSDAPGPYI